MHIAATQEMRTSAWRSGPIINDFKTTKLFCGIFTHDTSSDTAATTQQLYTIINTWGSNCDGFTAFSDHTNITLAAMYTPLPSGET